MILGMVTGTVVTTQKADKIYGAKYLLVNKCDQFGKTKDDFYVALDQVGAGHGEMVLMAQGSPNRQTQRTVDRPIDASIIGIVDLIDQFGQVAYKK
ncbi:MAG: EutN/CcmL family microcompartment protein [Planctomycetes bacterium]|nr:EutN/CcmL family microcompartment protein [Planctomycetota bacterium]